MTPTTANRFPQEGSCTRHTSSHRCAGFYERLSAGDVASFDEIVSADLNTVVVGTAPGEIHRERAAPDAWQARGPGAGVTASVAMGWEAWFTLAVVVGVVGLLVTERVPRPSRSSAA